MIIPLSFCPLLSFLYTARSDKHQKSLWGVNFPHLLSVAPGSLPIYHHYKTHFLCSRSLQIPIQRHLRKAQWGVLDVMTAPPTMQTSSFRNHIIFFLFFFKHVNVVRSSRRLCLLNYITVLAQREKLIRWCEVQHLAVKLISRCHSFSAHFVYLSITIYRIHNSFLKNLSHIVKKQYCL